MRALIQSYIKAFRSLSERMKQGVRWEGEEEEEGERATMRRKERVFLQEEEEEETYSVEFVQI